MPSAFSAAGITRSGKRHRSRCRDLACRAGNGTRTRDPNLGKVVLYQLSYSRVGPIPLLQSPAVCCRNLSSGRTGRRQQASSGGGGEGNRTPDLLNAIQALSQLSYAPSAERIQLFRQETRSVVAGMNEVKKRSWRKTVRPVFCSALESERTRTFKHLGIGVSEQLAASTTHQRRNHAAPIHQIHAQHC